MFYSSQSYFTSHVVCVRSCDVEGEAMPFKSRIVFANAFEKHNISQVGRLYNKIQYLLTQESCSSNDCQWSMLCLNFISGSRLWHKGLSGHSTTFHQTEKKTACFRSQDRDGVSWVLSCYSNTLEFVVLSSICQCHTDLFM